MREKEKEGVKGERGREGGRDRMRVGEGEREQGEREGRWKEENEVGRERERETEGGREERRKRGGSLVLSDFLFVQRSRHVRCCIQLGEV